MIAGILSVLYGFLYVVLQLQDYSAARKCGHIRDTCRGYVYYKKKKDHIVQVTLGVQSQYCLDSSNSESPLHSSLILTVGWHM